AGLPGEALLLEDRSRNTHENARHTAALLKPRGIHRVLLVSDGFHLLRARQQFRRAGLDALACPAGVEHLSRTSRLYWVLREALALLARPWLLFARRP
ncbi:MAG: YdcF family protein, partial [Myxococcales bacterium]